MHDKLYIFRSFWLLIAIFTSSSALALAPEEALKKLLQSKSIDAEKTAIYIRDIDSDYRLAAHRHTAPITPASVMKCITTAALQQVVSPKETILTDVYLTGELRDTVLNGDIIVVGNGDPTLANGRHKDQPDFIESIVNSLISLGISQINGSILIDDSLFAGPATPPSWEPADLGKWYGTGVHAFNFEGNVSGKTAVKNPGEVFRRKLTTAFNTKGINLTPAQNETSGRRTMLLSYASPQLGEIMESCMFRSDNLYAESLLRLFGLEKGADGSTAESAKAAMRYWENNGLSTKHVDIVDGSGLSRDNTITAEFLGRILAMQSSDPLYVSYFPLVGEEGTVKNFLKNTPLQGYMALKTGSMNGIQAYAGYVVNEDFVPTHVVVVIANGLKNRDLFRQALAEYFLTVFSSQTSPN